MQIDECVVNGSGSVFYADADGDGFGDPAVSQTACTAPDGYVSDNTDCDDTDAAVNPAALEICKLIDDNCNGSIDEGDGNGTGTTYFADTDNDGYGDAAISQTACTAPVGFVTDGTDCDDSNAAVNPGATEVCDEIDDNCDGQIDEGVQTTFYADTDGDTFGDAGNTTLACSAPTGYVSDNTDCDDTNAAIYPGATEVCNEVDDDCDGAIDEGVQNQYFADADGDTFGDAAVSQMACTAPTGYVSDNTDCDDSNAAVNPAATEICNLIDDDCDGEIDEGVQNQYFADADGDGFGDPAVSQMACEAPAGYVSDNTDCDDTDAAVNPAALEICNLIDDNCDGQIDEGSGNGTGNTYFADTDGDGYGDPASTTEACNLPTGFSENDTDCDDTQASVHPGATEICLDGTDQNCDGSDGITAANFDLTATSCTNPTGNTVVVSGATGGILPYQYSNDGGATWQAGGTFSGLGAGSYPMVVTDAAGCQRTQTVVVQAILDLAPSFAPMSCPGTNNASVSANPIGGYAPMTFVWKKNGIVVGSTETLTGLAVGTYKVTATDAKGCTKTGSVTVTSPAYLSVAHVKTNATCFGAANGTIAITGNGGTPGYSYLWSDGSTNEDRIGLGPGTYTVTLTDAAGCAATTPGIGISQPPALAISMTKTDVFCFGEATGVAKASASGGTGSKTYAWSNGQNTAQITSLTAGNYTVTTTDANSCTATQTVSITQPTAPLSMTVASTLQANGKYSVTVTGSGGTPTYRYRKTPGATGFSTTNVFTNVVAGTYLFEVKDAKSCVVGQNVAIPVVLKPNDSDDRGQTPPDSYRDSDKPSLFPNPAREQITVRLPQSAVETGHVAFTLTDVSGKQVFARRLEGNALGDVAEFSLAGIPAGFYLLRVQAEGAVPTVLSLEIQR